MRATGSVPSSFRLLKNIPALPDPWVWAVEVSAPDGSALYGPDGQKNSVLRLTGNTAPFFWGTTSEGVAKVWWPVKLSVGAITQAGDASVSGVALTVSNAFGLSQLWLAQNDDLIDHRVSLLLLNVATLNDPEASYAFPARVSGVQASMASVTVQLSGGDYGFAVPKETITPSCRHVYRKAGCGFALDTDGAILGPCVRTLEACELRGVLEVALEVTQLHPRRFGGFRGLILGLGAGGV